MRRVLHISLPTSLKSWLDTEVERRGYASANAFLRHLLVLERERIDQRRRDGEPEDQDDHKLPLRGLYPTRSLRERGVL
ncbi:MAG: hypothetical protein ABGY42_04955 [bacterium]|jgi:Arc/MetJ-type ribon-helix-helix transcriptional regulator